MCFTELVNCNRTILILDLAICNVLNPGLTVAANATTCAPPVAPVPSTTNPSTSMDESKQRQLTMEDRDSDDDCVGPRAGKRSSARPAPRLLSNHGDATPYDHSVDGMTTADVLSALSQRSSPPRLASLALAALDSPTHNSDEEVLRNAAAMLHRLTVPSGYGGPENKDVTAEEQLSVRRFLKSNGGVRGLLRILQSHGTRHPTTLSYALLAMGNLTAWDLDAHKQFREAGGVVCVAECMRYHRGNAGVQEKACYAIACAAASYSPKTKPMFKDSGCVDMVVEALSVSRKQMSLDAVTKQSCAALSAMCSGCPENAVYAASSGAVTFLVEAFDTFREASRVDGAKRNEMHLVGTAFMNLMCHPDNRRRHGGHGGTALMLRAMRIFRLDAHFIDMCLATLAEFCAHRANAMHAVQMNGVDDVIAAMVRFKTSVPVQLNGARTLSALVRAAGDAARRRIVQASGAEAIVFALERFGTSAGAHAPVAVEACRAIAVLCEMENLAEGEILSKRLRKIRVERAVKQAIHAHRGNQQVQEKGREALKSLGSLKSSNGWFSKLRPRRHHAL
jgi:hypothetical protein